MYLQLKTLFFFCLHFLQKGKKETTNWKKIIEKPVSVCKRTRLCVCVIKRLCLFVTDANKKKRIGESFGPGRPQDAGTSCWSGFLLGLLTAWLNEKRKGEGDSNERKIILKSSL